MSDLDSIGSHMSRILFNLLKRLKKSQKPQTTFTELKTRENQRKSSSAEDEVQIKRILVPLDGSNCSIRAAKYAIEPARLQKAQVFCIHAITTIPYGYSLPGSSVDQYFENAKDQAQSWFDKVIDIAKKEEADKDSNVVDIKTDIFTEMIYFFYSLVIESQFYKKKHSCKVTSLLCQAILINTSVSHSG